MKSIAVFLILNVLLLSSFTGVAKIPHGPLSCCASKTQKDRCTMQKKSADSNCDKGVCNAMLSCGTCGFVVVLPVSLSPAVIDLNRQPVHHFVISELSTYHGNDWNPPKA